jgi:hypothetical protein
MMSTNISQTVKPRSLFPVLGKSGEPAFPRQPFPGFWFFLLVAVIVMALDTLGLHWIVSDARTKAENCSAMCKARQAREDHEAEFYHEATAAGGRISNTATPGLKQK